MNLYLVLPLVQTFFSLALAGVVLTRRFRTVAHYLFFLFLFGLATWGVIIFCMRASPDIEHAYFWERWLIPLGPFISVLFYHFSCRYTAAKTRGWLLFTFYFICVLFIPLAATPLIFSGMQVKPYGYAPMFGPVMPFWMLFSYTMLFMALLDLLRMRRVSIDTEQRNRATYIIIGVILALIGGSFDVLPVLGLPLYPGAIIGNIAFCALTTIAIVKHNLLDIQIVVRKSVAYILTSAIVAIPFVGVFLLITYVFEEIRSAPWFYLPLFIVLAFGAPYLWQWSQQRVDRWFYRGRYDHLKALEAFSQQTQSITDSAKLGSVMVDLIAKALQCRNVYFLQPSAPGGEFVQVAYAGSNSSLYDIRFSSRSVLVKYLERSRGILSHEDIEFVPQLQGLTSREKETLERIGAKFVVGLKASSGRLSGLLVLGPKLSEGRYTVEDKQLISAVGSQVATNLENARLYNESLREMRERKQAETALLKYKLAVDNSADLIAAVDRNYVYILANQTFLKYHCLELEQVVGHTVADVLGEEIFKEIIKPNIDRCLRGQVVECETEYNYPGIGSRCLDILYHPLKSNNRRVIGVVAVMRDVTDRKKAEERERKLQEELALSGRLAAIGQLAAGVAHEINNPLTAILGFSEWLLQRSADKETARNLKIIYDEAQRAANVVRNLLTFARRREPARQPVDINDVVQKALELRAYEFKSANIEVITKLTPGLPQVLVDFQQIEEVFLNIILNAEQVMSGEKGRGRLVIKTERANGYVRVSFTDNGPGIHPEHLDKIFDPFFTTKGERGGTGLGLSICHGIVTKHGGKIYAKSELGKGATFFVELPVLVEN